MEREANERTYDNSFFAKNLPARAETNGSNSFAALQATISFSTIALSFARKCCSLQAKIVPSEPPRTAHEGRLDPASINSWPTSAKTCGLSIHARCPQDRCSIHRGTSGNRKSCIRPAWLCRYARRASQNRAPLFPRRTELANTSANRVCAILAFITVATRSAKRAEKLGALFA